MFITIHLTPLTPQESKIFPYPVSATQISNINRKSIIRYLKERKQFQDYQFVNIITKAPRNYLIDLKLSEDINIGQEMLPLQLELVIADKQYRIYPNQKITLDHFAIISKIGEGTYAQVFLIERKYDRSLFCMKRINKIQCLQNASYQTIRNEEQILREVRGRQIVRMYYSFQDNHYVYLILQFCPYGDLKQALHRGIHQNQKYQYFIEICFGIAYLHARGIIYRDLKPENIVIDVCGRAKLCDFGFAKKIRQGEKLSQICGSYEYIAPQVIDRKEYNKSLDLYTLGLLFYEMISGQNPFSGLGLQKIDQIKQRVLYFDNKLFSPSVKELIQKLMKKQASLRCGYNNTDQIFSELFFQENYNRIIKVMDDQVNLPSYYYPFSNIPERNQILTHQPQILNQQYNFTTPKFDVTTKMGPKFNSNF